MMNTHGRSPPSPTELAALHVTRPKSAGVRGVKVNTDCAACAVY